MKKATLFVSTIMNYNYFQNMYKYIDALDQWRI